MKLPTIDQPIFECQLLSREKPVQFRPFIVKEQKIMMMAVEAKEIDTTIRAIKQIIKNCVVDDINVDELPLADLETLFINLRAHSMGEVLSLFYKCTNQVVVPPSPNSAVAVSNLGVPYYNYQPCGMIMEVAVDLMKVEQINTDLPKKIMLSDKVGVIMKYPSIDMIDKLLKANDSTVVFSVVASCIDQIFDTTGVYKSKDATQEEMLEFVETLPPEAFEKLGTFVDKTPKTIYKTKQKCGKCGYVHDFLLEGISDFFT